MVSKADALEATRPMLTGRSAAAWTSLGFRFATAVRISFSTCKDIHDNSTPNTPECTEILSGIRPIGAMKPEHHFEAAAPVDAHPDALDFNFRREITENTFGTGMELERGRD